MSTLTRRGLLAGVAGLAGALALGACGVPLDSGPRALSAGDRPTTEVATAPPEPVGGASSPRVYFLTGLGTQGNERLQEVSRDVAPEPRAVLAALLKGLTSDDRDHRLQTAIPAGTKLIDTDLLPDGTLQVNVDSAFFGAKGESQTTAVAQIVYTATALSDVKRVQLLVDNQPKDWSRGDGVVVSTPLTRFDYPDLNPSSQPDYPPELAPSTPTTASPLAPRSPATTSPPATVPAVPPTS